MENNNIRVKPKEYKKLVGTLMKQLRQSNIGENKGMVNLQKYILLKKLKPETEMQILRVSQFLNSLSKNERFLNNIEEKKKQKVNLGDITTILNSEPHNRGKKEIFKLKDFFVSIGLPKLFEFPNYNEMILEKLIVYCCINSKVKLFKRNAMIYNIGDTFDKYYIFIGGNIGKYKIIHKLLNTSGFTYFKYIFDLYIKKEKYLLKLILEKNYKSFPIDESMMENLHINLAKYIIDLCQKDKKYINIYGSKEDILKQCFINPKGFINRKDESDENNIEKENSIYSLLSKTIDKNDIHIFEYLRVEEYTKRGLLETLSNIDIVYKYKVGNNTIKYQYDNNMKRNYALKALSSSYLCYFDLQEYIYYFIQEYKIYMREQASLLINNFIFKKIAKNFEKLYFNYFEFVEINPNEYLFKENQPVEYIYLLKEGMVELTINKNIFKIQRIINILNRKEDYKNSKKDDINLFNRDYEKNEELKLVHGAGMEIWETNEKWKEDKKERIVIFEHNEILGLECLYLGINYFYCAKLGNQSAKFYRIRKDKLNEILEIEQSVGINLDYQKEAERKINFFLLRLINLTKVKINCFKSKKIHNIMNVHNQMNLGRNFRRVKLNLTYKKAKLRLNPPNLKRLSLKPNKNINDTAANIFNIFELTSPDTNLKNKSENDYGRAKPKIKNLKTNFVPRRNYTEGDLDIHNENESIKINKSKSVNKISVDNSSVLSVKSIRKLVNRLNSKFANDQLFFTKIKTNKKFKNDILKEKIKTTKSNNSYTGDIYDSWKTFHTNIYIDLASHKKKLNKINWYKNIDKFPFNDDNNEENKISNKLVYGMQIDKKKVAFIDDKLFPKSHSFLSPS